jgi:hypothetical protein
MNRCFTKAPVLALCLAAAIGCQDQKTDPTSPSGAPPQTTTAEAIRLDRGKLKLPASARMTDHFGDLLRRAINADDYVCGPTDFDVWLDGALAPIDPAVLTQLLGLAAHVIPTVDAIFFVTEDTPQFFGVNGEYTKIMLKTERDTRRFWNIQSSDIQLLAMHGSMLLDKARVARAYQAGFTIEGDPIDDATAAFLAGLVHDAVLADPDLRRGNHPLFTLNAFALSAPGFLPDKIVMGDGILEAYRDMGYDDVAPQAIYAHEFAHHIQFENGYFDDVVPGATTQAELTRYTELMADAYAAYYLTHKRGGTMNKKRVAKFLEVFFAIGDCAFANPGHHGTPNQRMRAARFGFQVADEAQKKGHILTSEQFHERFVAVYPQLVAPDAT